MAIKNITVPDFGGVNEVVVIEVLVKPGNKIGSDTSIVTLESDKATMDLPAGEEGVVKEVKVKVGDKVSTGTVILTAEISAPPDKKSPVKKEEKLAEKTAEKSTVVKSTKETEKPKPPAELKPIKESKPTEELKEQTNLFEKAETIHAGPAVRRLAREFGVDLTQMTGSGFKQRILKEDVQSFVKTKLAQTSANGGGGTFLASLPPPIDFAKFGPIDVQALSRIKKISGKNLHRNWVMIPHVTQFTKADITDLDTYRQKHKARFEKEGLKLTPLVFIMKAVVECLRKFPNFNASLDSHGENLVLKKYFHIGVAVDTPDGLVVPVIRDINQKRITVLAKELAATSEKARNKQLTPNDMQGGCFSISSLGGIGGTAFTPIINYPEVAILGVSKVAQEPIYRDGAFIPRFMLPLSLSYDHRVIDGAEAARFIVYLADLLSDIRHLLL